MTRARWTGFGGVSLLVVAAWAGVLLPASPAVTVATVAGGVTGMGLTVLAWLTLRRATLPTLVLWCAPVAVAPPLFSRDVFSYLAQGAVAARGLDPHVVSPIAGLGAGSPIAGRVDGHWQHVPSPYGPLTGALQRAIHDLTGGGLVGGVALHRLVAVAGIVLAVRALVRLCRITGTPPDRALWLGALCPLVAWHLVAGVHNDALMLGLMLAGTAVALDAVRTPEDGARTAPGCATLLLAGGVALVALGAMVKLPAALALAVIAVAAGRRFVLVPLVALVVAVATSVLSGIGFGWIPALATTGSLHSWMAPTNWPGYLAGAFGLPVDEVVTAGRATGVAWALAVVTVVLVRQWQGRLDPVTALAWAMTAVVVLGPVVQPWYLLWALLPLAASAAGERERRIAEEQRW